jgi:hypothetical protein
MFKTTLLWSLAAAAAIAAAVWFLPPTGDVWLTLTVAWTAAALVHLIHSRVLGPAGAGFRRVLAVSLALAVAATSGSGVANRSDTAQRRDALSQQTERDLHDLLHEYALGYLAEERANPDADLMRILMDDTRPRTVLAMARFGEEGSLVLLGQSLSVNGWDPNFQNADRHTGYMQATLTITSGKELVYERQN